MRVYTLLGLGLLWALPALPGELYIPFVAPTAPGAEGGRTATPVLDLQNLGRVTRRYAVLFTPAGADGGRERELVGARSLAAGESSAESCCAVASGLLVVTGAPQIAASARLGLVFDGPAPNALFTRLPVLTVREGVRPRSFAVLRGLRGAAFDHVRSSLGILNLERLPATCSVNIGILDLRFPELTQFVVPPLSVAAFPDVFEILRGPSGPAFFETRTRVSCDRLFYPFGINYVGDDELLDFVLPVLEFVTPSVPIENAP
jgi:hypothetical protein